MSELILGTGLICAAFAALGLVRKIERRKRAERIIARLEEAFRR